MKKRIEKFPILTATVVVLVIISLVVCGVYKYYTADRRHKERSGWNKIDRKIVKLYKKGKNKEERVSEEIKKVKEEIDQKSIVIDCISGRNLVVTYDERVYEEQQRELDESVIGELLDDNYVYEPYVEGESEEIIVEIYSIKDISTELAVAVKEVGEETFHYFKSWDYKADNLKKLVEDYGFHENVDVCYVWLDVVRKDCQLEFLGESVESMIMKELIENGEEKKLLKGWEEEETGLNIVMMNDLGTNVVVVSIKEHGNIWVYDYLNGGTSAVYQWEDGVNWAINLMEQLYEDEDGGFVSYE